MKPSGKCAKPAEANVTTTSTQRTESRTDAEMSRGARKTARSKAGASLSFPTAPAMAVTAGASRQPLLLVVYPDLPEGLTMPEPDDTTELYAGRDVAGAGQLELAP